MKKSRLEKEHTIFEGEVALDESYFGGRSRERSDGRAMDGTHRVPETEIRVINMDLTSWHALAAMDGANMELSLRENENAELLGK